jgi:hypothetical protein
MHAFKFVPVLVGMAALLGLSGCANPDVIETTGPIDAAPPGHAASGPNEDGQPCSDTGPRHREVYIQIAYDASGMPVVHPEQCRVNPGTRITWRGPDDLRTPFEIAFKAASASADGQGSIASAFGRDRSRAAMVAARGRGSYAYSIIANGKELDPQIIIDPR